MPSLSKGLIKRGQIPRIVVGQLHSELCDLKNGNIHNLMLSEPYFGFSLKNLGMLEDVRATFEFTTGNNVVKDKNSVMLDALVS